MSLSWIKNENIKIGNIPFELGHYNIYSDMLPNLNNKKKETPYKRHWMNIRTNKSGTKSYEGYYHKTLKTPIKPNNTYDESCSINQSSISTIACFLTLFYSLIDRIDSDLQRTYVDHNHFKYNENLWNKVHNLYDTILQNWEKLYKMDFQLSKLDFIEDINKIYPNWLNQIPDNLEKLYFKQQIRKRLF